MDHDGSETGLRWLRQVMQRYERPLVSFAAHLVGNRELARDLVQDTFERLCHADQELVRDQVGAWLFRVCRNRALDVIKKEGRMRQVGNERLEAEPGKGPSPSAVAEARQELGHALQQLATLPENQQEVVRLKLQAGLSYREISEVTGHTVSNVGVLLHTALRTLRQRLGAQNDSGRVS
jgi:RNA polymerase sigma-70 factor (ECF subfamily)